MESTSFTGMIKENMCFGFDGFVRIIAMCRLVSSIVLQCVKQAAVSSVKAYTATMTSSPIFTCLGISSSNVYPPTNYDYCSKCCLTRSLLNGIYSVTVTHNILVKYY